MTLRINSIAMLIRSLFTITIRQGKKILYNYSTVHSEYQMISSILKKRSHYNRPKTSQLRNRSRKKKDGGVTSPAIQLKNDLYPDSWTTFHYEIDFYFIFSFFNSILSEGHNRRKMDLASLWWRNKRSENEFAHWGCCYGHPPLEDP